MNSYNISTTATVTISESHERLRAAPVESGVTPSEPATNKKFEKHRVVNEFVTVLHQ